MGIKGLMKLVFDYAPNSVHVKSISDYFGLPIAIDASMSLYQFLIAVRYQSDSGHSELLTSSESGAVTSHITGMFYRTIRMLECGIKPIFVFDGKAPVMKAGELAERRKKRVEAAEAAAIAKEEGNIDEQDKFERRQVKVTVDHVNEVKRLLRLMGVPIVEAAGEAEATCAYMTKCGQVYATGTEDMDSLTFGSTKVVRGLTFTTKLPAAVEQMQKTSGSSKLKSKFTTVYEIDLARVLQDLHLNMKQFIELCILMGCDYAQTIRGVGAVTAYKLLQQYGDIDTALRKDITQKAKYKIPDNFEAQYKQAVELFEHPDVADTAALQFHYSQPDVDGLQQYLVTELGFGSDRVAAALRRLVKARVGQSQKRLDNFFAPAAHSISSKAKKEQEEAAREKKNGGSKRGKEREASGSGRKRKGREEERGGEKKEERRRSKKMTSEDRRSALRKQYTELQAEEEGGDEKEKGTTGAMNNNTKPSLNKPSPDISYDASASSSATSSSRRSEESATTTSDEENESTDTDDENDPEFVIEMLDEQDESGGEEEEEEDEAEEEKKESSGKGKEEGEKKDERKEVSEDV